MKRRELIASVPGLAALAAGLAALPTLAFYWASSRLKDPAGKPWADLGPASRVEGETWQRRSLQLEVTNRWRRESREEVVYLRRRGDAVEAVSAICPHTGCLVKSDATGFACPCHKSLFDADGRPLEGPAPRALDRLACRIDRGRLFLKYQRFRPGTKAREPLEA